MRGRALLGGSLAAFGLISLGGAVILAWNLREQTRAYFTDADTIDRPAGEASPRDVLWRDPTGLPPAIDTAGDECAPGSSADGHVLYFARRQAGTGFDLYVTARSATGWSEAQPVAALNSAGDEIDPHVSPDGRRLYFASDRPGGSGRFDLWVAALGEQGPGEPANLGALVNGAGNECGPALDPAGSVLYFASDRARASETVGAEAAVPDGAKERRDFDIYSSRLDVPGPAEAVAGLNSPSQETTPAVSPAGDFVYFASDRPGGPGGFDLYRARRVRGDHTPPENLGLPVNTPEDELDPEVVLEGFGLYFVSKSAQRGGDIRYTASREVFRRTEAWRAALRWQAVWAALWPYACWVLGASLLLFLLGKYFTHLKYRKLSLFARCMMVSLLGHLVLLVAFAYWIVNVPEEPGPEDEAILISFDLPSPGDGMSLQLFGEGTGAGARAQAAPARISPWSAAGEGADLALAAAPSALEPAAMGIEAPAADAPTEIAGASQLAASQVEPAAAPAAALPELAPSSSGEPSIVVREPAGAAMERMGPAAGAGAIAVTSPTPGAAELAGEAAMPAGSPGIASAPTAALPTRVTGGAPPQGTFALRLPEAGAGPRTNGEASERPSARPSSRGSGAGLPSFGGEPPGGAENAPGIGAPQTDGTALAPGVMAPMATSPPRGDGGAGEPRGAGPPPPLAVQFPAMDVAPTTGGGGGGDAGEGVARGAPGSIAGSAGAPQGRAEYVAGPPGGTSGPASVPGPIGAAALVAGADRGAPGAIPLRLAGTAIRAGREPGLALPAAPGLELRIPDAGPPPEVYANRAPEIREEVLGETGGSAATERAVEMALDWLARHQSEGGRWDGTGYDRGCGQCPGRQRVTCDTALTGLSLLCFMAAGHTHVKEGPHRDAVQRGLDWLVEHQDKDGGLLGGESMYSHGIASIALAEAYGMTRDPLLERPVRLAVEFIDAARNRRVGGWRYRPGQPGDTSIMGWQVMALKSARLAGIDVPQESFDAAAQWLDLVHRPERVGTYAYQPNAQVTPAMTAEGMFIAQLLGAARNEPRMQGSASFIVEHLPSWKPDANTYYWYYATLALFQHQGEEWSTWNEAVKDVLIERQETEGAIAGSWAPEGQWATVAGRVYQTAMAALTLEVYYRYLPRYVQDPGPSAPPGAPPEHRVP